MATELFQELNLSELMGERFGRYSKYIIQERAIPDVRDGLKPVQRRIIYAMYHEGNSFDKAYRKSAKTVGNVIGNYHPHGDTSVYDAMVRLSQEWKMREPLIDMQGNNGSMDGDPPAAMRYTEARLAKIAQQLTTDLDKDTVDWVLNFDDTEEEPTVLPAQFPHLLVNGATGISAGYATDIPPHNLGEVIDGCLYLIDHPQAQLQKLMTLIPGPDFPTGGIIQGRQGLEDAYQTGKGKIVVRAASQIESMRGGRQRIVVDELPYEVNKAQLIQQIDDIRLDKDIEGIAEVRDETDKEGLRIVIEIKKDAQADGILTYLLKQTDLQVNYNLNMVAIHDKRPVQMGLKDMLQAYLDFRQHTIIRRTRFLLHKAEDRQHIVEGLIRALTILDAIIQTIRQSKNKADAKANLIQAYEFTDRQAEAIVSLQLYRLSNTDVADLRQEGQDLADKIKSYQEILSDETVLKDVMKKELRQSKKDFASLRRTVIEEEVEDLTIDKEVLIAEEEVIVTVSQEGYLKRTPLRSFAASDLDDLALREGDHLIFAEKMTTLDQLILFTSAGQAINRPVYSLADLKWKDLGSHISQEISLAGDEKIIAAFGLEDFDDAQTFILASQKGYIKQTLASDFQVRKTFKSTAYKAMNLEEGDQVVDVALISTGQAYDVFIANRSAYGLRFPLDQVSVVGAGAKGVKSMLLKDEEEVVGFALIDPGQTDQTQALIVASQRGAIKKLKAQDFPTSKRNSRGLKVFPSLKTHPHQLVDLLLVHSADQAVIAQTSTGQEEAFTMDQLKESSRQDRGQFIFKAEEDGQLVQLRIDPLERLAEES